MAARIYCAVYGCMNSSITHPEITFFRLPGNTKRRLEWLQLIQRDELVNKPKFTSYRVCEKHFDSKDIQQSSNRRLLKKHALPLLKLPSLESENKGVLRKKDKQTQTSPMAENAVPLKRRHELSLVLVLRQDDRQFDSKSTQTQSNLCDVNVQTSQYNNEQSQGEDDDEYGKKNEMIRTSKKLEQNIFHIEEKTTSTIDNLKRRRLNVPTNTIEFEDTPVSNDMSFQLEDEDRLFLHSLLPAVRKLNVDQKLEFRTKVLQSLKNIRHTTSDSTKLSSSYDYIVVDY